MNLDNMKAKIQELTPVNWVVILIILVIIVWFVYQKMSEKKTDTLGLPEKIGTSPTSDKSV